jgi:hypothetical protein
MIRCLPMLTWLALFGCIFAAGAGCGALLVLRATDRRRFSPRRRRI